MKSKLALSLILAIVLASTSPLVFNIQPAKADWTWTGTIYIRVDGSVEPDTAPISTVDNITYTLKDNIVGNVLSYTNAIIVERDDVVIEGAGYAVQGTGINFSVGIAISGISNVTIRNTSIRNLTVGIIFSGSSNNTIAANALNNNGAGIWLSSSSRNNIVDNNVTGNNYDGIYLAHSSNNNITGNAINNNGEYGIRLKEASNDNNTIARNNVANNGIGISISNSIYNTITGNNITNNTIYGIHLYTSSSNLFSHNNFMNNTEQVYVYESTNVWNDSETGNYWSDYQERYPNATETDGSSIWDIPYVIDENNQDNYPIVPEFPSLIILSLFMVAAVVVALINRRKHILKT